MKQYLLLLKSSDFNKADNIWTSNPINLYHNSTYSNYSYTRSYGGLNLINDTTFVGTEVTSPSYSLEDATPIHPRSIWKTNVGEVVYEEATPSLLRFIDTSSRVDVLSYRHQFTNVPGTANPTFNIEIWESDTGEVDGPWLKSIIATGSNALFIRNVKPYIKVQLELYAPEIDISNLGLVFYLELGIHDPVSPVISTSGKNILRRFPSWTSMFEDSVSSATPTLDVPSSTGGKFLTSIVQESLDIFQGEVDAYNINSYINSADEEMLAWLYSSYNVPANIVSVEGDGIQLARIGTIVDFLNCRETDYVFYYSPVDRKLITLRGFEYLAINGTQYRQNAENLFNDFDEFGARVGLPRLNLESNLNYKKRILDVNNNISGVDIESFKRTLRRELDIWRAYGSTPDSNYVGATPEILEISDIESSHPYFDQAGKPQQAFYDFVDKINSKYPSNIGYVRWDEGVWDYDGVLGEGVGRIPAIHDTTPGYGSYYQAGVGDLDDARIAISNEQAATVSFDGLVKISGVKYDTTVRNNYAPVNLLYSWYLDYVKDVPDYNAGGLGSGTGVALTYEIDLPAHDNYTTPSTFYVNLNYLDRDDFYVGNSFSEDSSASPEFNYIKIFNQDGLSLTNIDFRDKEFNSLYENTEATPTTNSVNLEDADEIRVVFNTTWNQASQNYEIVSVAPYRSSFSLTTPNYYVNPNDEDTMVMASPNINYSNSNLLIGSTIYQTTPNNFVTDTLSGSLVVNAPNIIGVDGIENSRIEISDLIDYIIYPPSATPNNLYINVSTVGPLNLYNSELTLSAQGGIAQEVIVGPGEPQGEYIIPSSPNIKYLMYASEASTIGYESYFDSATISYDALPEYIEVFTENDNVNYPFMTKNLSYFEAQTTPSFFAGYIDQNNNTYLNEDEPENYYINSDEYLDKVILTRDSFNLDPAYKYIISSTQFEATPNGVIIYSNDSFTADLLAEKLEEATPVEFDAYARKENESETFYTTKLKTGWIHINNDEYYIYSDPVTDEFLGQYFTQSLSNIPRMGSPVIVSVDATPWRNISFEDSATPGMFSFQNRETIIGNESDSLYLAYENVTDVTVVDKYTGNILFQNLDTRSNVITPFDLSTPSVEGREYEVIYYVNESFHIEKDIYSEINDVQSADIYFSSTPDTPALYKVTYEQGYSQDYTEIDLDIDQSSNPLSEGYIFASKNKYPFSHVETHLSPRHLRSSINDLMYLTIISYDEKNNLKPNQSFYIEGDYIQSNPQYVTTNKNGYTQAVIRYIDGATPYNEGIGTSLIKIFGVGPSTPNSGHDSETEGFYLEEDFVIKNQNSFNLKVKASPIQYKFDADGNTDIQIVGKILWNDTPFPHAITLKWAKAETLYDLFNEPEYSLVNTNSSGEFIISNLITASDKYEPKNWFVSIEINDDTEIANALQLDGLHFHQNDFILSGDIVYWTEMYDSLHYANENVPISSYFSFAKQNNSDLIATPNFVYDHSNPEAVLYYSATPSWEPPRWVPLSRFDQYQMNLLGSTPNYIFDMSRNHPDYGEF